MNSFFTLSNDENVLVFFFFQNRSIFLTALTSDQDLAARFFLEAFLVHAFRTNEQANVVNASVLWKKDFA